MGRYQGIYGEICKMKGKPIVSKKTGILIIALVGAVFLTVLWAHQNPFADPIQELVKKIVATAITAFGAFVFIAFYDKLMVLPAELWQNRRLIVKLSVNDFKTRYAGSYLGMVWALVQPVVTVLLYWFVFGTIMKSRQTLGDVEVPYVLWLTAGLVPWLYFSEALSNGTNALLEYHYLVKKVVFKISILPIIKVFAATFMHVFFAFIMLILYVCYGYKPDIHLLQLIYFSFCMFILVLAMCYTTCAVVVFFRDLNQIIGIFLQVGMWATPILWNITQLSSPTLQIVFKLNPIFYIVNGYRSALFEKTWFWEDFYSTMYFWIVVILLFGFGALIFKRLKVHFADVM